MSDEKSKLDAIARARVEKLAENLKGAAESVLEMVAAEEIEIEPLLEATRFMARTARRIGRRANWPAGEPAPGNEKEARSDAKRREAPKGAGGRSKDSGRSEGGPRRSAPSGGESRERSSGARRSGGAARRA